MITKEEYKEYLEEVAFWKKTVDRQHKKGRIIGRKERATEIAKRMKEENIDVEKIAHITGLLAEDINNF